MLVGRVTLVPPLPDEERRVAIRRQNELFDEIVDSVKEHSHRGQPSVDTRQAVVEHVADGDSLVVVLDGRGQRVRLAGIDAPEKGQPFAEEARAFTASKCLGQTVQLIPQGHDKYERLLAEVIVDDINLNERLVAVGLAWCFDWNDRQLSDLERQARTEQRGLWSDPNPIRPSQWRRQHRDANQHGDQ